MSERPGRVTLRGFDLRLENGFTADEARAVIERVLATGGDRVSFTMDRPAPPPSPGRQPRLFVKAEFRRPNQPLSRRLKPSRAVAEGRGYRAFQAAGLPVPRILAFGEQSRLRPRAGAIVVTEKIRGLDATRLWRRQPSVEIGARVARTLAAIHAAGFVHGDAAVRNFVLVAGAQFAIDLTGWAKWSAAGAERDLALFVGSTMKLGADSANVLRFLDEYEDAAGRPASRLAERWRERVSQEGDAYRSHLVERDASRPARHAKKLAGLTRPRERAPSAKSGR